MIVLVFLTVFTGARRRSLVPFVVVVLPATLMVIVSALFPLVKAKPPVPVVMNPSSLSEKEWNTSILVAIQPMAVNASALNRNGLPGAR
jgi:hypothetical protein